MGVYVKVKGEPKKVTDIFINNSGEKKRCTSIWEKEGKQIKKVYSAKRNVWAWIDSRAGTSCVAYMFSNKFVYPFLNVNYTDPSDGNETYQDIRFFRGTFYVLGSSGKVYRSNNLESWEILAGEISSKAIAGGARFYKTKSRLFIIWEVSNCTKAGGEEQYTRYYIDEINGALVAFKLPGEYLSETYVSPTVASAYLTAAINFFENAQEDTLSFFFKGTDAKTKMQTIVVYSIGPDLKETKKIETCESYEKYSAGRNNLIGWYDEIEMNTYLYIGTAIYRSCLLVIPLGGSEYSKENITSSPGYSNSSAEAEAAAAQGTVARIVRVSSNRYFSKSLNNMRSILQISDAKDYLGNHLRSVDHYIFLYGGHYLNWIDTKEDGKQYRSAYGSIGALDKGVIE